MYKSRALINFLLLIFHPVDFSRMANSGLSVSNNYLIVKSWKARRIASLKKFVNEWLLDSAHRHFFLFHLQFWKSDLTTRYEKDIWRVTTGLRSRPMCHTGRHVMWHGLSLRTAWIQRKIWTSLENLRDVYVSAVRQLDWEFIKIVCEDGQNLRR